MNNIERLREKASEVDDPMGHGATEAEAIADLISEKEMRSEDASRSPEEFSLDVFKAEVRDYFKRAYDEAQKPDKETGAPSPNTWGGAPSPNTWGGLPTA